MSVSLQVVIDCLDPAALAGFWAEALGYVLQPPPPGFATWEDWLRDNGVPESEWNAFSAVVDPDGVGPRLFFQRVPEPKQVKTRVHLDLHVGGGPGTPVEERRRRVDETVARLLALDAERVQAFEQRGEYWVAMRDPEGTEFDVQ
ncbi:MAG: VOC family protein [Acidimicrobiia bacterium]